ncbi:MAG: hypothetical protein EA374_02685, partial [Acholeplasmatales bacterium]
FMWGNYFFWWLLFFGSLRERIRNLLPVLLLNAYLITAFYIGDFATPLWILTLLPFASFLLRTHRRLFHVIMLALASLYLVLDVVFGLSVPLSIRLGLIAAIYLIYIPLRLNAFIRRRERQTVA